jgi:hypothetical protein
MKALRACGLYIAITITFLPIYAHAGWTPPVRISDEGYSLGPRIAANGDSLHAVYGTSQDRSFYLRSEDAGSNWGIPLDIAFGDDSSGIASPLIVLRGDTVALSWRNSFGFANRLNWGFRLSLNAGHDWGEIYYILPTHTHEIQKQALAESGSVLFFVYSRISQQEIIVEFAKSTDWGETWTEPTEVFRTQETGRFDMVARGDTIHFMWIGRFNYDDEWETYYIKSDDSGETWSDNVALSTLDDKGSLWSSISANDDGDIVACWMDFKYSPYFLTGDIFVRYSHDAGDSWTDEDQLTSHHRVRATRILWQSDSIHITWEDWRGGQTDIYYMRSIDNGLSWEDEQRVEEDPGQSLYPDLAVADETVHVVWRQDSGLDGRGIYYSRWDEVSEIPTLSEWGMLILALLLMAAGTMAVVRRSIISKRQDVISFPS